ncbi:hypothetical protein ANN_21450 [Periplaneta americana]|uniref:Uncharacterized protein n=1 Tax=Periplaneta americana TaxID=6978 RepID=A0ABQ8SG70_PERAM|nr:hypothetical protein ANN_21450 [Periplaneta americana]
MRDIQNDFTARFNRYALQNQQFYGGRKRFLKKLPSKLDPAQDDHQYNCADAAASVEHSSKKSVHKRSLEMGLLYSTIQRDMKTDLV